MGQEQTHTNRLADESSPYLLLHQHNPVDWHPWGEEALALARRESRPIFLSIGYSTCYWCHVMERESFSNPAIAELMNRSFVNIKVDREERPELDEIYMAATQILTQQGGWPNSVFLTPELKPFFAGTYFPPEERRGMPGFPSLLSSLAEAWQSRRREVEEQAESVARALRHYLEERHAPAESPPGPDAAATALAGLKRRFDPRWGGFGGPPKFPTPANLFLLEELTAEQPAAAEMLTTTLDRMARGGIYDQLAGGFHRYATDGEWRIPHFEKMLYDNGLLLELYAREWQRTGDPEMERVARETAAFLRREMTSPEGGFWSAIDAETEGREGAYYVWTRDELKEVLGEEDFGFLAPIYGFDVAPFFEGSFYVLHLPGRLAEQAQRRRMEPGELGSLLEPLRARLFERRSTRPRPLTDHKILADWNGMAISGMAVAGRALGDPGLVRQAAAAADFVLEAMRPEGGPLCHAWPGARGGIAAFLGDYAFLVRGLLALDRADGDDRWLAAAIELAEEQKERLGDPRGGFFVAAESQEVLFRSKEVLDGAVPSGNAIAALNLVELAARTGEKRWAEEAERSLKAFAQSVEQTPDAVKMLALAARRFHQHQAGGAAPSAVEAPPAAGAAAAAAKVVASLGLGAGGEGGWRPFRLRLTIQPGWHLYAHAASAQHLRPTAVEGEGVALRRLEYPAGRTARLGSVGEEVEVYEKSVEVRGELRVEGDGSPTLKVSYQACDDRRCLAPSELALPIRK
ncbi:MAG: DUF255 domain-containing protein [Thermoanaerobaculia bacterium]